jgi:hypothetical protein
MRARDFFDGCKISNAKQSVSVLLGILRPRAFYPGKRGHHEQNNAEFHKEAEDQDIANFRDKTPKT